MCGIVGIIDRSGGTRILQRTVEQMVAAVRHRGPDGTRIEINGQFAFGFARLSIIDLAGGMQPMWNERRTVLSVCNGEIFNYRELRERLTLQGVRFRTDSDTEVIPFLYERYGSDFVDHLDGQYSIAIYDIEFGTLVLTRDPFGITPLFYAAADGFFLFASEIKALLVHPSMKREVNLLGLDQTFMLPGLVSPVTMFKGVSSVQPGCQILVEPERPARSQQYWDVSFDADPRTQLDEDAAIEALDDALRTAVTRRLIADVPIGVYLSGGLDSTLIAALVVEQAPLRTLDAFGAIVAEGAYSEANYQRQAARALERISIRSSSNGRTSYASSPISFAAPNARYANPTTLRRCCCRAGRVRPASRSCWRAKAPTSSSAAMSVTVSTLFNGMPRSPMPLRRRSQSDDACGGTTDSSTSTITSTFAAAWMPSTRPACGTNGLMQSPHRRFHWTSCAVSTRCSGEPMRI